MFTSRAEYRILLRQDNADERLTERAYHLGLASEERYRLYQSKRLATDDLTRFLHETAVKPAEVNALLTSACTTPIEHTTRLIDLVLRPQITITMLAGLIPTLRERIDAITEIPDEVVESAEIQIKYQGYIDRERQAADKLRRLDYVNLPENMDYNSIQSLSTEARQKLSRIRPRTIGDANRIPGVSPNDISVLLVLAGR
jgi:tRNA uridine 5-carboxymethylaminomethyl modification enzyme